MVETSKLRIEGLLAAKKKCLQAMISAKEGDLRTDLVGYLNFTSKIDKHVICLKVPRLLQTIAQLLSMQISEQILLRNQYYQYYPPTHQQHYYPLTLAF